MNTVFIEKKKYPLFNKTIQLWCNNTSMWRYLHYLYKTKASKRWSFIGVSTKYYSLLSVNRSYLIYKIKRILYSHRFNARFIELV
jgi:hypothetical protein